MTASPLYTLQTPSWSPLVPAWPLPFRNAKRMTTLVRLQPGTARNLVPAPLEVTGDFAYINWLSWDTIENGRLLSGYNTSINFPISYQGLTAKHCSVEYFSYDSGLAAGREDVAFPKKSASIAWTEIDGRHEMRASRDDALISQQIAVVNPDRPAPDWTAEYGAPDVSDGIIQVRRFGPALDGPATHAQVEQVVLGDFEASIAQEVIVERLDFFEAPRDTFAPLGNFEVLAGKIEDQNFDMHLNRVIDTVEL
ncbi:acetoacetate decarboxylase family protein [Leucobacter sp. GX24907]